MPASLHNASIFDIGPRRGFSLPLPRLLLGRRFADRDDLMRERALTTARRQALGPRTDTVVEVPLTPPRGRVRQLCAVTAR